MSTFGNYVDLDVGLHPSSRLRAQFFVPTPPTDADLLLFQSVSTYSPSDAVPLEPWLAEFAALHLGGAVARGERLRRSLAPPTSAADVLRPGAPPGGPSAIVPRVLPSACGDGGQNGVSQVVGAEPSSTGGAGSQAQDRGAASLGPPIQSNQVVARGIKTVDELLQAWDFGWKGYGPMKELQNGAGGKLDKAQVNLLSKAKTVRRKVLEMGREEFRSAYEVAVEGKLPTLSSILTRIEQENGRQSIRGKKRARNDMTTTE